MIWMPEEQIGNKNNLKKIWMMVNNKGFSHVSNVGLKKLIFINCKPEEQMSPWPTLSTVLNVAKDGDAENGRHLNML